MNKSLPVLLKKCISFLILDSQETLITLTHILLTLKNFMDDNFNKLFIIIYKCISYDFSWIKAPFTCSRRTEYPLAL